MALRSGSFGGYEFGRMAVCLHEQLVGAGRDKQRFSKVDEAD
jgi:hypothetical protein